jgi:hypothetical protein
MYLKWGTVGGKGMGSKGKGGEASIQPTRDLSGRESHHDAKERFQVSRKGVQGWGQGFPRRGLPKGLGYALRIMLILYISC